MKTKEQYRKEAVRILWPIAKLGGIFLLLFLFSPLLFIWTDSKIVFKVLITLFILNLISFLVYKLFEKIVIISADKLFEEELLTNPEGKNMFQSSAFKTYEETKSKQITK